MAPPTNVVSRCQCDPNCPNPPIEGTSPFCKEHANGKCERISPLSGELPYAPNQYNKFPGIKEAFNCFAYAFGLFMLPNKKGCTVNSCPISFHQPGYKSGHPSWSNSEKSGKRCPDLISRIFGDVSGNKSNKKNGLPDVSMCHFNTKCPEGMRKIAVIVDAKQDYHFLRLDNNHYWSHKPGATDVTNVDASGRLIWDPQLAVFNYPDSNLNYENFCGYLCIPASHESTHNMKLARSPILSKRSRNNNTNNNTNNNNNNKNNKKINNKNKNKNKTVKRR